MSGLTVLVLASLSCGEPVVDARDGRSYPTVRVGGRCWTARNAASVGGTCYGNDPESCRTYGGLYTWDQARQACPAGWHLPSREEWEGLAAHVGTATAGEKLKARQDHVPPFDGTDEVGFTALPAGAAFRGSFGRQGHWAVFWTSTENGREQAVSATLDRLWHPAPPRYRNVVFDELYLKENAFSVRCTAEITPSEIAGLTRSPRPGSAEPRGRPAHRPSTRPSKTHTGMYANAIGANNMRTSSADRVGLPNYEAVPPPAVRPFPESLRAAGYYTTNNAKTDYQFAPPLTAWDENGREAHWKNRPEGMPFFSVFNLETTHESQVWDRANDPVVVPPERVILPPYYPDTPAVRRDVARVYSNVAVMDRQVGELLAELEEAGLADDTIVFFYSGNGGPLPRGKREMLDSGLHVPFLVRFPEGAHAGTVVDDLVAFVDVPATILSLAGVPVPKHMQGRPFWGDQKASPREYVFAARDRMDERVDHVRAVRDRCFKYVRNYRPAISRATRRTARTSGGCGPPSTAGCGRSATGRDGPRRSCSRSCGRAASSRRRPRRRSPGRTGGSPSSPDRGLGDRLPGGGARLPPRTLAALHRALRGTPGRGGHRHREPRRLGAEHRGAVRRAVGTGPSTRLCGTDQVLVTPGVTRCGTRGSSSSPPRSCRG